MSARLGLWLWGLGARVWVELEGLTRCAVRSRFTLGHQFEGTPERVIGTPWQRGSRG